MPKSDLTLFENFKIRRHFDEKTETWYFSIVDICGALTDSPDPKDYWYRVKKRMDDEEAAELSTICRQLKLESTDGKKYNTDCADTEGVFRIIQSIPSPKAEPFKRWLAKVGTERIAEIQDPSQGIDRARENWKKHGRSEKWIQQRMTGQETRNKLTDYWNEHGVKKGDEFAVLTNMIHEEWAEVSIKEHKNMKGLKTQNLRDHMSEAELIFTALAELSTRQIADSMQAEGFVENKIPAKKGGQIAKDAKKALEAKTGKKVVTGESFLSAGKNKGELQ